MESFQHRIVRALGAGTRGLVVSTPDERRGLGLLEQVGESLGWPVHTWSAASGIDGDGRATPVAELLARLRHTEEDAVWVLLDGAAAVGHGDGPRMLRELAQREHGPAVVLLEPHAGTSVALVERVPELVVEQLPPPDAQELELHLREIAGLLESAGHPGALARLQPVAADLARQSLGLGRATLERLVAEAVLDHGIDPGAIGRFIARHKPTAIDRHGLLTPVAPAMPDELGGLHALKTWLGRRALALRPDARLAGIPDPRGMLLLGVQGCGKSLAARVSATMLGLPLVRLEPGRLFAGTVGESEANLRRVTEAAERIAPVVLWLDEIDKGLAGLDGAASDAGTTARVIGGLLTWLQERTRPVFVVATANRVEELPPELTRRGRLDEVFFLDLPGPETREAILRVHLETLPRRRLGHVPPLADDWSAFAAVVRDAEGLSGAEIESALTEARLDAFAESRPLAAADLRRAIAATVPLSTSRAESVQALRRWAKGRARTAE